MKKEDEKKPLINNVIDQSVYGKKEEKPLPFLDMKGIKPLKKEDEKPLPFLDMKGIKPLKKEDEKKPLINNVVLPPEYIKKAKKAHTPVLNMQKKLITKDISGLVKKNNKPKKVLRKVGNFHNNDNGSTQ